MSVHDYVANYRFELDGGGSYCPSVSEETMIEDAIEGYIASLPPQMPTAPHASHWLGGRESADATRHEVDTTGCVLYFKSQEDCHQFMHWLTHLSQEHIGKQD